MQSLEIGGGNKKDIKGELDPYVWYALKHAVHHEIVWVPRLVCMSFSKMSEKKISKNKSPTTYRFFLIIS